MAAFDRTKAYNQDNEDAKSARKKLDDTPTVLNIYFVQHVLIVYTWYL